jgi:hypothetical protein
MNLHLGKRVLLSSWLQWDLQELQEIRQSLISIFFPNLLLSSRDQEILIDSSYNVLERVSNSRINPREIPWTLASMLVKNPFQILHFLSHMAATKHIS